MIGEIFSIPFQGLHSNYAHLGIVLAVSSKNCLIVPAFGEDGAELKKSLISFERRGVLRHDCSVILDNSKYVNFEAGWTGKEACWLVGRHKNLSEVEVKKHKKVGSMNPYGLGKIVECALRLQTADPKSIPPKMLREIQSLNDALLKSLRSP